MKFQDQIDLNKYYLFPTHSNAVFTVLLLTTTDNKVKKKFLISGQFEIIFRENSGKVVKKVSLDH